MQKQTMRVISISLALVCAIAAGIFLVWPASPVDIQKPVEPGPTSQPSDPKTLVPLLRYQYQAGDYLIFKATYISTVQIIKNRAVAETVQMEISGKLHQKIYEVKSPKIFAGYVFKPSKLQVSAADKTYIQQMSKALETEVYVSFINDGTIERWFFPEEIPPELRNTIKSLLINTQVVFPAEQKSDWQIQEQDMNGSYTARYKGSLSTKSNAVVIFKQKTEYLVEPGEKPPKILLSRGMIQFDPAQGIIQTLHWNEQTEHYALEFVTKGDTSIQFQLDRDKINDPQIAQSMAEKLKKGTFYTTTSAKIEGEAEFRKRRLMRIIGTKTWQDLQKEIGELRQKEDLHRRNELYRLLGAWFELHPESIATITAELLNTKDYDNTIATILGALSDVQNPLAQQALAEIIEKRKDNQEIMLMAVTCLAQVKEPTEASIQLMQQLHRSPDPGPVRNSATLAIGSMAGELRKKDPGQANALIFDIEKGLESARDSDQKRLYLQTLGNAGSPSSLPYIENAIKDPDENIRANALDALRFIESPQADILLAQNLQQDSFVVRNMILETLNHRKPSQVMFSALQETISKETSENLKVKEARALWQMRKQYPQAEAIVKQISTSDPSPKVRQMVQSMMLVDRD